MKKRYSVIALLSLALVIGLILWKVDTENVNLEKGNEDEFVIATHYFADEWPINFWNAEWDNLENDLKQIRQDGFNTIILVVPWREFQPGIQPVRYDETCLKRLEEIIKMADKQDLDVQLRLGYINDFGGESNSTDRFYDVVGDAYVQEAWMDYAKTVYSRCKKYSNFKGGFITWEDFWHNYALVDYVGGKSESLSFVQKHRFDKWIEERYTLEEFNDKYATNFENYSSIYVPINEDSYAIEWFQFIDEFTIKLLQRTQEVFPGLSMEVRTDYDPVGTHSGKVFFNHQSTWPCVGGDYTAIMYKPSQGANGKDSLSSVEAIDNLNKWLENIYSNNGKKPLYVEQFLFVDNTPGYYDGSIIQKEEMPDYLVKSAEVLKKYAYGYGVWVYKDYANNLLYNPQFALGVNGWEIDGKVAIKKHNKSNVAKISAGSEIYQIIPFWHASVGMSESYEFTMDYELENTGTVSVQIGTQLQNVEVEGKGKLSLQFQKEDDMTVKISSSSDIYIDNIKLYNFIQSQKMYDINNQELEYIEAIRELNKVLSEKQEG